MCNWWLQWWGEKDVEGCYRSRSSQPAMHTASEGLPTLTRYGGQIKGVVFNLHHQSPKLIKNCFLMWIYANATDRFVISADNVSKKHGTSISCWNIKWNQPVLFYLVHTSVDIHIASMIKVIPRCKNLVQCKVHHSAKTDIFVTLCRVMIFMLNYITSEPAIIMVSGQCWQTSVHCRHDTTC